MLLKIRSRNLALTQLKSIKRRGFGMRASKSNVTTDCRYKNELISTYSEYFLKEFPNILSISKYSGIQYALKLNRIYKNFPQLKNQKSQIEDKIKQILIREHDEVMNIKDLLGMAEILRTPPTSFSGISTHIFDELVKKHPFFDYESITYIDSCFRLLAHNDNFPYFDYMESTKALPLHMASHVRQLTLDAVNALGVNSIPGVSIDSYRRTATFDKPKPPHTRTTFYGFKNYDLAEVLNCIDTISSANPDIVCLPLSTHISYTNDLGNTEEKEFGNILTQQEMGEYLDLILKDKNIYRMSDTESLIYINIGGLKKVDSIMSIMLRTYLRGDSERTSTKHIILGGVDPHIYITNQATTLTTPEIYIYKENMKYYKILENMNYLYKVKSGNCPKCGGVVTFPPMDVPLLGLSQGSGIYKIRHFIYTLTHSDTSGNIMVFVPYDEFPSYLREYFLQCNDIGGNLTDSVSNKSKSDILRDSAILAGIMYSKR